jgi:hypothetical protein
VSSMMTASSSLSTTWRSFSLGSAFSCIYILDCGGRGVAG